jgi:hypothetical protein
MEISAQIIISVGWVKLFTEFRRSVEWSVAAEFRKMKSFKYLRNSEE